MPCIDDGMALRDVILGSAMDYLVMKQSYFAGTTWTSLSDIMHNPPNGLAIERFASIKKHNSMLIGKKVEVYLFARREKPSGADLIVEV